MTNFRLLSSLVLFAVALSACTMTSSQVRTEKVSLDKSKSYRVSEDTESVSDVYYRSKAAVEYDSNLRRIISGSVPSGKNVVINMQPDFGRKFHLCDENRNCEQFVPTLSSSGNNSSTVNTPQGEGAFNDTNFIGDVKLSEQSNQLVGAKLPKLANGKRILIMDPDIELSILTAGGLQEPNALWTSAAKGYVTEISAQYFQKLGHTVTLYKDGANSVTSKTGQDLINLHEAVGQSIFLYQYEGMFQLPTMKKGGFNWKLGKTTKQFKDGYGADLGLFVYLRDSYSSGSRVAAQVLMSVLFGTHIQGGQQVGFVSLVDMDSGDIVWFNRLHSTTGDLRTFGAALNATDALLEDAPL